MRESLQVLKKAINDPHGCDAMWVESVPVKETFQRKISGKGTCRSLSFSGTLWPSGAMPCPALKRQAEAVCGSSPPRARGCSREGNASGYCAGNGGGKEGRGKC